MNTTFKEFKELAKKGRSPFDTPLEAQKIKDLGTINIEFAVDIKTLLWKNYAEDIAKEIDQEILKRLLK